MKRVILRRRNLFICPLNSELSVFVVLWVHVYSFLGNAEWLYCKSRVCGVTSVIHDLDQSSQHTDCTETRLIRDALVLIKPTMDFLDSHMGSLSHRI